MGKSPVIKNYGSGFRIVENNKNNIKTAIIDCGTNTFHLLIAEYDNSGYYNIIKREMRNVKLGRNTILKKIISRDAFEKGIKAFIDLNNIAKDHNADSIHAYATSAIRSAENGQEFVDLAYKKTKTKINVIDGYKEAHYIYNGVMLALEKIDDTILIMDIGGGSTEFIIANNNGIIYKNSFDLGVARILKKLQPSDPLKSKDIIKAGELLSQELKPLSEALKHNPAKSLIGSSGSFESIYSVISEEIYGKTPDNFVKIEKIDHRDFYTLYNRFIKSTEKERYNIKGLLHARVDTIVLASLFVEFIINQFKIKELYFSNYALKEGVLAEMIGRNE